MLTNWVMDKNPVPSQPRNERLINRSEFCHMNLSYQCWLPQRTSDTCFHDYFSSTSVYLSFSSRFQSVWQALQLFYIPSFQFSFVSPEVTSMLLLASQQNGHFLLLRMRSVNSEHACYDYNKNVRLSNMHPDG